MNFLFTREYEFVVNAPIQSIRNDLNKMVERFKQGNETIKGKLNFDDTFILKEKWIWGLFFQIFAPTLAYLKGRVIEQENRTIIKVTLKPNPAFIIFFYIIPLMFVNLISIQVKLQKPISEMIYIFLFSSLFYFTIYAFVWAMSNHLINRFKFFMTIE